MKICKRCGEKKPQEEFFTRSKKTGAVTKKHSMCISCRKKYDAEYYQKNRQKLIAYQKKYAERIKQAGSKETARDDAHIISIDDAYIYLACAIIASEIEDYHISLQNYDSSPESFRKIQRLEQELCTPYYEVLTMGVIDLEQYCKGMRKRYKIPIV